MSAKGIETATTMKESVEDDYVLSHREKQIMRRIDLRLVLGAALGYSVNLMDRGNVGMAAIAGMLKDLDFVGYRYSLVVLMFFVTYGMGFAKTWSQVLAIRILLGVFAAGYFPGCMYLLSCWYLRYEVQKRFSVFYGVGCVASALAGILAFGLIHMDGIQGISGWRWIFIMEGVITVGLGVLCYVLIVDFPDKASRSWKFLTEEECDFVIRRIDRDRLDAEPEAFTLRRFLKPALDIKIWGYAVLFGCLTINTYAMAYFLPIILSEGMGFGVGASQCLSAPPWVFAALLMFAAAWVGDKIQRRVPVLLFNVCLSLIGLPMMGFLKNNAARYVGVFLTVAGANANVPACMAWQANNIRGQWTRAFSSATLIAFDGIGGIIASLVFEKDAPRYRPGVYTALGANIVFLLTVVSLAFWYRRCNKKADRGELIIAGIEGFRYTI
ncbi:Major facilitator superfamily domaingeneral substrate transporter [Penicillium daleae]|uniref:Major facilitator superfamily domaingeneral substrate transporter n=1 Tax=Penicillium daleae TaxID=63821 RepID=A0AAD6CA26_9EURO|nr:Major facilitator superfamily domaingeneral substrate transporter [Penicillium daleae]KAJ5454147.1 Major facilitator superfamily domaingeneral substrate transporter [Penicillium daleae]